MYSTCLFCHAKLGSNEVIEHFPVGRRLAFDAGKGRLWVVCRGCERWNLTPIEERWEAIEECERAFRGTRLRVSTDNIGLARINEGLELVRVGAPQRPEMAAWRYGDQFGRRRARHLTITAAAVGTLGALALAGPVFGFAGASASLAFQMANAGHSFYRRGLFRSKLKVEGLDHPLTVNSKQHDRVALISDDHPDGWALFVPVSRPLANVFDPPLDLESDEVRVGWDHGSGHAIFVGDAALRVAGQLLPMINRRGAGKKDVQNAVEYLGRVENPRALFAQAHVRTRITAGDSLHGFPAHVRLALEMSTHEDVERRAFEGELALLETAWQEAEEIAGISDNLLVPASVTSWIARARRSD